MNILFDFLTARMKSGAGEYARRVFFELIDRLQSAGRGDVKLFVLHDSSAGIAYADLREDAIRERGGSLSITFVDCRGRDLAQLVEDLCIDVFFIACGQYVGGCRGITRIACRVVMTLHDISLEDLSRNHIPELLWLDRGVYDYKKRFPLEILNQLRYALFSWKFARRRRDAIASGGVGAGLNANLRPALELFRKNRRVCLVTDSYYTLSALRYHFALNDASRMVILYPPCRVCPNPLPDIEDGVLRDVIASGRPYFLMVSANRELKNARKAIEAFRHYRQFSKGIDLVAIGYKKCEEDSDGILTPAFLSDSDLEHAYENCHALLYPSLSEGFGYPPIEAMKYGKPVLCSNVTSLPEVLGDAPVYFSPFYNADIFQAMTALTDETYGCRSEKSLARYKLVSERQKQDLRSLMGLILGKGT